ncbi:hypothetical protein AOQ84DRAFT_376519 [Glonium stellatum]|uniref:Uncharacterized protein n=1 Tax=Glonium stellatum TaxID=574774 RepID=A0A8E2F1S6_9PEZI|nr:hypothetical protein AOQ84DRAFT_376519 [Glonium stellatum]
MKLQSAEDARLKKVERDRQWLRDEAEEPVDERDAPLFEPQFSQADEDDEDDEVVSPSNPRERAHGAEGEDDGSEGGEAMDLDPGQVALTGGS